MSADIHRRWAIFSDTHGNLDAMRDAAKAGPFDAMIHLGDGIPDASTVSREWGIPLIAVSGNEDGASEYPERLTVSLGPYTAILLHGHRLDINPYQSPLVWNRSYEAMETLMAISGSHLLLYGHTHIPVLKKTGHGIICNPGNQYIGSRTPHTFAIAEIDRGSLNLYLVRNNNGECVTADTASIPGAG